VTITKPRDNNKLKTRLRDSPKLAERKTDPPLPLEDKVTDLEQIDLEMIDPEEIDLPEQKETDPENPEEIDPQDKRERSEILIPTDLDESEEPPEREESPEKLEDPEKIDPQEKERKTEALSMDKLEKTEIRRSTSENTKTLLMMESETSEPTIASPELDDLLRRTRREVLDLATGDLRLMLKKNWPSLTEKSRKKLLRDKLRLRLKERLLMLSHPLSPRNPKRRNFPSLNSESNEKLPSLPCLLSQLPVKLEKE